MVKKLLQLFLLFVTFISLSQEKGTLVTGKIIDSLGIVKNANIINLKTNQGTFSSDDGNFDMYVSLGDSLQISSIQHVTRKIIINDTIISAKYLNIELTQNTYVLEEFELRRNHLTGLLAVDANSVPNDKRDAFLKKNMDFSNIDFSIIDKRIDENIRAKAPAVNTVNNSLDGVDVGKLLALINPFKKQKRKLLKFTEEEKFNPRKVIPNKILADLGESFFFENLKIPKNQYFNFLSFCDIRKIESLYKEDKILDLIEIFRQESNAYLKTIKKE